VTYQQRSEHRFAWSKAKQKMSTTNQIYNLLKQVPDPEIPVLNVLDLGIVRKVEFEKQKLIVTIPPTYSGCPAMNVIEQSIQEKLIAEGYQNLEIKTILSPAWTTNWLTEEGKQKLLKYGIAPPVESSSNKSALFTDDKIVPCPQCTSHNTTLVSEFGSTPCKSLYKCKECLEPFDYFKCH